MTDRLRSAANDRAAGRTYNLGKASTPIREELGYAEPIAEAEALQRTIVWEQENMTAANPE